MKSFIINLLLLPITLLLGVVRLICPHKHKKLEEEILMDKDDKIIVFLRVYCSFCKKELNPETMISDVLDRVQHWTGKGYMSLGSNKKWPQ